MHYIGRLTVFLLLFSCAPEKAELVDGYPRQVGDIYFDPIVDDSLFIVCNEDRIFQYFHLPRNVEYIGEKTALIAQFTERYQPVKDVGQTGMLRIRFIVNCTGETGRYRLLGVDPEYKEKIFDKKLTDQLVKIISELNLWVNAPDGNAVDYYHYLIFKLEDGEIIEILP